MSKKQLYVGDVFKNKKDEWYILTTRYLSPYRDINYFLLSLKTGELTSIGECEDSLANIIDNVWGLKYMGPSKSLQISTSYNKFKDYIAIPASDNEERKQEYEECFTFQWVITTKFNWAYEDYLDSGEADLNIPGFYNCMENTYECIDEELMEEEQAKKLKELGFEVLPVTDWDNHN